MTEPIRIEGMESVRALLAAVGGTLDEASRLAQNKMAYEIYAAEKDQMKTDLASPTPWSVGALRYKKAGEGGGAAPDVPGAADYMENAFQTGSAVGAEQYLGVQTLGGQTAGPRASEKVLQAAGLMPPNTVWVPDRRVKLNAYGNVQGGVILAMITDLTKRGARGLNFAVIGKAPNQKGILTRIGDQWVPFLWFVSRRTYRPRLDFYGRGDQEVADKWRGIWDGYVQLALEKAAQ